MATLHDFFSDKVIWGHGTNPPPGIYGPLFRRAGAKGDGEARGQAGFSASNSTTNRLPSFHPMEPRVAFGT